MRQPAPPSESKSLPPQNHRWLRARKARPTRFTVFFSAYLSCGLLLAAFALRPSRVGAQADDQVRFNIKNPGQSLFKLAIPQGLGDPQNGALSQEVLSRDLALSGFFEVLDPRSFLANVQKEELGIGPDAWRSVNAAGVIKARLTVTGGEMRAQFRLFEVVKGDSPVLSKDYTGPPSDARHLIHRFAADVVKYFTTEDAFFATQIAFSQRSGKAQEIVVMDWDGAAQHKVTSNGSQNLLPSWSPGGGGLLYTSFIRGTPDLWSVALGGKPKRVSTQPGLNTGGVYSPDGSKIALTLSKDGNSEIYLLNADGSIIKRLTSNSFIDSSPTWSPDGSQIAFVSDRYGSPQIWVMSSSGAGQTKLTRKGNYNQEPAWAPRPINGQSLIAFSARDEKGNYDVFTVNSQTQEIVRLTENRGSNNHPTWAPNARALAYLSSRGGIWVATADGKTERQVHRGDAEGPTWGPLPKGR